MAARMQRANGVQSGSPTMLAPLENALPIK
jgi:hypothetical protein